MVFQKKPNRKSFLFLSMLLYICSNDRRICFVDKWNRLIWNRRRCNGRCDVDGNLQYFDLVMQYTDRTELKQETLYHSSTSMVSRPAGFGVTVCSIWAVDVHRKYREIKTLSTFSIKGIHTKFLTNVNHSDTLPFVRVVSSFNGIT